MSEQANPTALAAERLQDMNNQEIGGLRLDEWCDYWQRTEAELGEDAFKFETESEKHMLSDLRAASKVLKSYLALTSQAEQDDEQLRFVKPSPEMVAKVNSMKDDLERLNRECMEKAGLTAEQDETKPTERPDIAAVIAKEIDSQQVRHEPIGRVGIRTLTAEELAAIIRKHTAPLVEAAKLCRQELSFMLNHYPERRGGAYERALDAVRAALVAAEEGK